MIALIGLRGRGRHDEGLEREGAVERKRAAVLDDDAGAGVRRLEPPVVVAVRVRLDDLFLEARARRVRVAVDEPDDVGAVASGLLAAHLELDGLPGRDREPVAVAVNRGLAHRQPAPQVAHAAQEDAVHRLLLGREGLVVEDLGRLAPHAREDAEPVLLPRLAWRR